MIPRVRTILLSPKVAELVDEEMAHYLLQQLHAIMGRPPETVPLRRGNVQAWGVELTSEDGRRAYKVAFLVEEDEDEAAVLSVCSLDEKTQLEAPVSRRKRLKGWCVIDVKPNQE